jgi:hypothetical protein
MDDGHIRSGSGVDLSGTEARQASREGVVRYVLAASLALVIIAFAIAYAIYF